MRSSTRRIITATAHSQSKLSSLLQPLSQARPFASATRNFDYEIDFDYRQLSAKEEDRTKHFLNQIDSARSVIAELSPHHPSLPPHLQFVASEHMKKHKFKESLKSAIPNSDSSETKKIEHKFKP